MRVSSSRGTSRSWRCCSCWRGRTGLHRDSESRTVIESVVQTRRSGNLARTPLANAVEEAVACIADEDASTTRRGFLKGAGATLVGASLLGRLAEPAIAKG